MCKPCKSHSGDLVSYALISGVGVSSGSFSFISNHPLCVGGEHVAFFQFLFLLSFYIFLFILFTLLHPRDKDKQIMDQIMPESWETEEHYGT